MKYAVFVCGGMADRPMPEHNNITALSASEKENIDIIAKFSETGLVRTAEFSEEPSPEKALFSLMGYDAGRFFKGSTVFSLYNMDMIPENDDIILRCSPVRLSEGDVFEERKMISADAENMTEDEFDCIFSELSESLSSDVFRFVKGMNRDIFIIWKHGEEYAGDFSQPENALSGCIGEYLPKGDFVQPLYDMMAKSSVVLEKHSSNAVWIWGNSAVPKADSFEKKFGLKGTVVSDTDFARGIGRFLEMKAVSCNGDVSEKILSEFEAGRDIVFFYSEDMYETGLKCDFYGKAEKISEFDREILKPVLSGLEKSGEDFGILIVSDICVPAYLGRYSSDPVPYLIYKSSEKKNSGISSFDENTAADTDNYIEKPYELIERLISRHG